MLESVSGKKIVTLEDPIEIYHEGFMQVQVNADRHLSYAEGIREFMRQDPDIIMIGEIRDEEAAAMAVRSALTGHLVVTSIHAPDTKTALYRLMDLGVKEYHLKDVVRGISCQKLIDDHKGGLTGIYEIMDEKQIRSFLEKGTLDESFITLQQAEQAFEDSFKVAAWQSRPIHVKGRM